MGYRAVAQQSNNCSPFLYQKDTTICPGTNVILNLIDPPAPDSLLPGVWKLLIKKNALDSILFNIKAYGYDKNRQYLYSIIHQRILRYDLKNNLVTTINATNWPGDFTEFVYDFSNDRLLSWRNGRDTVYTIPAAGGAWMVAGAGNIDRECYGASAYWNPLTKQPGLYGGYGYNLMKNWIFENTGTGWQQMRANALIDSVPPKGGNLLGTNQDGTKLFLFSGQGNYTGDELSGICNLGSPWATAGGMFCWLKDLWELDLTNYRFQNILPVNNTSIQYEGAFGYDYDKTRFYIFGGYQPTGNAAANAQLANTNKTYRFRRNKDNGFISFIGEGDLPPALPVNAPNGYAYYDAIGKRMIWARYDGIWAYYPDSTLVPVNIKSLKWSTGDTSSSITVKPLQTTQYKITRTYAGLVCTDSIKITVPNMQTLLVKNLQVCGDSVMLDAGNGFDSTNWSTGETSRKITAKQSATYFVKLRTGLCSAADSSKIQLATPIPDFTVKNEKDSICPGETDSLFIVSPQPGLVYNWYVAGNAAIINSGSYFSNSAIVKNTDFIVTATRTTPICPAKNAQTRIILRQPFPKPVLKADSITVSGIRFSWNQVPGATSYLLSLDRSNNFFYPANGPNALSQSISGLLPNKTITVSLKVNGTYSCQTSDTTTTVATTLNPFGDGIYTPNAFSPNGDGINDLWFAYGTAINTIKLMIYNQWGKQVFVSNDLATGWDGTEKGNKLPAGIYRYALEAIMQNGKKVTRNGTVTLLR
jgi:gliding motility-associated-like protein